MHSRVYKGIQGCTRVYKGLKGCLRVYKGVLVRKSEYTFFGFLIWASVTEIERKTTFPFSECIVGLEIVN